MSAQPTMNVTPCQHGNHACPLCDAPPADAMHASVTFLTWDQLTAAMKASCDEYETRFAAFLAASQDATEIASGHGTGCGCLEEAKTAADSEWAGCQAQSAMTGAIAAEMRARQLRKDYGPTATATGGE